MYRRSFPKCTVEGDQSPSKKMLVMASKWALPTKCISCQYLFEGECLRDSELIGGGFLQLDYGYCGVDGPTEPFAIEEPAIGVKIFIPTKCKSCQFLYLDSIRGYVCKKDQKLWGDGFRGLDWGDWEPNYPNVGLERLGNSEVNERFLDRVIVTEEILDLLMANQKIAALKLYRSINAITTIKHAKDDIELLDSKLKKAMGLNE